ncbi:MAG TPA: ATPase domain-containing protein, partial [Herpetosiphonaceae bacterium]
MIASDTAQNAGDQPYSTGNPELDLVMSGGFPGGALSLIVGPPGAGKTVLATQLAFAAARGGRKVVYLTNVSESHARLIKHIRALSFFDEQLLTRSLNLVSVNTAIQSQGSEATINFIADVARDAQAELVVIDSYLGLQQLIAADSQKRRETLFNLMARLRLLGASTVLVGEYPAAALGSEPEFAVADCVIELAYEPQGMRRRRLLSVLKMRGTAFLEGLHPCAITARGVEVFPRLESLPAPAPFRPAA